MLAFVDERRPPRPGRSAVGARQTLGVYALMVGTLQLARALSDRQLADEVLEQGVRNALALMDGDQRA